MNNYKLLKGYSYKEIKYGNYTLIINYDWDGDPLIFVTLLYSGRPDLLEESFSYVFETDKLIPDILNNG